MQRIGIIAAERERVAKPGFFRLGRRNITESFSVAEGVEAVVLYAAKSTKHLAALAAKHNIKCAVCTGCFVESFGRVQIEGVEISDGKMLYRELLPQIIKRVSKMACASKTGRTLAVDDENPGTALFIIESLCNDFQYITVVSKNKNKARDISEKILNNFGLPVIIANSGAKIKCDAAVKTGGSPLNVHKNTIVIDAASEHTKARKNLINWAEVEPRCNLPYDVDSLSFAQAMRHIGEKPRLKLTAFRCGGGKFNFENRAILAKKIDNA